jgi:RecA-family ATPase
MVRGLDDDELDRYTDNLVQITLCDSKGVIKWTMTLLKATEEQKVEAYIKAKGVCK